MIAAIVLSFALTGTEQGPESSYTVPETVIVAHTATETKPSMSWHCGAPRALATDASQTVRVCSWVSLPKGGV